MPDYGKRTGRDAFESLERRLAAAERELRRGRGGGLSTIDRGDTGSQPAPVEGQMMIQYDTDVAYVFANGAWQPLGGGGGGGPPLLGVGWAGPYPYDPLTSAVWKVPQVNGASVTFDFDRLDLRLETPGSAPTTVIVQKSVVSGVFTPVTVGTLSIAAGAYQSSTTAGLGQVTSGNLLRIRFTAVGALARGYLVQMEGTEA